MSRRLSRRTVLRGATFSIALPALEAMLERRARAQSSPPVRLVTFFLPNGFPPSENRLIPAQMGRGYALTPCLEPVARHVGNFTLVTNINGQGGPDSHAAGITAFATGLPCTPTAAKGPSLEQLAARRRPGGTKFPSLVVGVQKTGPYSSNGHSSEVFLNVSWQDAGQLAPADRDPDLLFARLFGNGAPVQDTRALEALRKNRKSVLDHVRSELERLAPKLGSSDRSRLDAHLTGVRELERRLPLETAASACTPPAAPGKPAGHTAKALLMVDLLAMALRCNLTHHASYMYADGAGAGGPDDAIGLKGQQHEDAHAGNLDSMQRFTTVQMQAVARFLDALAGTTEGGQTLLASSLVMIGTELGNGTKHTRENLPFLIAGNAGGRLKTNGTHIRPATAVPIGRLHLSLLKLAGIDEPSFAGETQPLSDLLA